MQSLFAIVDLAKRWHYTKAGVHKLSKQANFPLPVAVVANGRFKVYALVDVQAYEQNKPWLFDADVKEQRIKGYLQALDRLPATAVK